MSKDDACGFLFKTQDFSSQFKGEPNLKKKPWNSPPCGQRGELLWQTEKDFQAGRLSCYLKPLAREQTGVLQHVQRLPQRSRPSLSHCCWPSGGGGPNLVCSCASPAHMRCRKQHGMLLREWRETLLLIAAGPKILLKQSVSEGNSNRKSN